jgi:release factor glutamine methyltransferase
MQSNWFSAIEDKFDVIVSNPPYLAEDDVHLLTEEIRHEPRGALVADKKGLADIEHIIAAARDYLQPQGYVFIEHGQEQGQEVRQLFALHGYQSVATAQDLASLDRITFGKY